MESVATMTKDDVIALAEQAGIDCDTDGDIWGSTNGALLKFASLVAAAEREACAQIVEAPHWKPAVRQALAKRAAEIRARGM